MTEYGGSEKGLKQSIVARSTEQLARAGVLSPDGNAVPGHDEMTPAEMRGVLMRGGNSSVHLPLDQQEPFVQDPISERIGEASKLQN